MRSSFVLALAIASLVHALALPSTNNVEVRQEADLAVSMDFYDRDQDVVYPDVYTDVQ